MVRTDKFLRYWEQQPRFGKKKWRKIKKTKKLKMVVLLAQLELFTKGANPFLGQPADKRRQTLSEKPVGRYCKKPGH